jgi:hypothetical protein
MSFNFNVTKELFSNISNIEPWKSQRTLRDTMVDKIVNEQIDYKKEYGYYAFPGAIVIVTVNNKKYIIDGQHRHASMKKIMTFDKCDLYVNVEERFCQNDEQANQLYEMLNNINTKNTTITNGKVDPIVQSLKILCNLLKQNFKQIWHHDKSSFPYIHLGTFEEKIKHSGILKIYPPMEVYTIILNENEIYGNVIKNQNYDAYKKAKEYGKFFLHYKFPKSTWISWVFNSYNKS